MNEPKGYTALINPYTGRMELSRAFIPMPGDPDYHPKFINNFLKENVPHPLKCIPMDIHPAKVALALRSDENYRAKQAASDAAYNAKQAHLHAEAARAQSIWEQKDITDKF